MTPTRRSTRTEHTEDTADRPDFDAERTDTPTVNCREVHGERRVFTESGNTDGWIATDHTVELEE